MAVVRDYTAIAETSWNAVQGLPTPASKPIILTYSFPTAVDLAVTQNYPGAASSFQPFTAAEQEIARAALDQWAKASGVTFIEAPAQVGDVRFSWLNFNQIPGASQFSGYGFYPTNAFYSANGAVQVFYSQSLNPTPDYYPIGGDTFYNLFDRGMSASDLTALLLHEIGHALGLKHPFEAGTNSPDTLAQDLDNTSQTVMSYTDSGPGDVLGPIDIAAVQYLYGGPNADGTQFAAWSYDAQSRTVRMTAGAGDNVIRGTSLNDHSDAGAGADAVFGGVGNDTIVGGAGLDAVAGGPGLDTYVAGVSISAQRTMFNSQTISLAALGGQETIREFERIQFTDGILALDLDGNAGHGYRIYQAAFARTPDKGSLSYWVHALDSGASLQDVANGFAGTAEFKAVYGAPPTHAQVVDKIYHNVLGRAGEASGTAYWTGLLDSGSSVGQVLAGFSESPENVAKVAPAIAAGIVMDLAVFV